MSARRAPPPPDREREIRTTRNPKQAPLSTSHLRRPPPARGATRESKIGRPTDRNKCSHVVIGIHPSIPFPDRARAEPTPTPQCQMFFSKESFTSHSYRCSYRYFAAHNFVVDDEKPGNEFVAADADLAMMCTMMMRAGFLHSSFPPSLPPSLPPALD